MTKLKLQPAPVFSADVPIAVAGEFDAVKVRFTFKHRSRDELKTFVEASQGREDVDTILDIAQGWELTDPFTPESLTLLAQNYIAAPRAIFDTYIAELTKAREKKLIQVARAIHTPQPDAAAAAAWGFTLDEASGPPIEIWPDNLGAVNVFLQMNTQWRIGFAGATGLDYGALQHVLRLAGHPRSTWPQLFDDVRVMEDAALRHMHAAKK